MSFEEKFSQEITNFQRYGTFSYEYDEVGNVIFNSSSNDFSQIFLAFPLPNYTYDSSKILNFYDPTFTEFTPQSVPEKLTAEEVTQIQKELESEKIQTGELTKKLDDLIAINEATPSLADQQATKQVILELRVSLGQGRVESDFSENFPYSPIKKEASLLDNSATTAIHGENEPLVNTNTNTNTTERVAVQGSAINIGKGPLIYTTNTKP